MGWFRLVIAMSFSWTFLLPLTELLNGTVDDMISCCLLDCCLVSQLFSIRLLADMLCFFRTGLNWDWLIHQSIDWLINRSVDDWLIDWSTDRSIDWLIGCWLTGYSGSFLRSRLLVLFYSVPCAHERCDPCAFLLALRGFVELISVMVRFRSSVLFRPAWRWLKNTPSGAIGETHGKELVRETVWPCGTWSSPLAPIYNICIEESSDPRSTCEFAKLGPNMLKKSTAGAQYIDS